MASAYSTWDSPQAHPMGEGENHSYMDAMSHAYMDDSPAHSYMDVSAGLYDSAKTSSNLYVMPDDHKPVVRSVSSLVTVPEARKTAGRVYNEFETPPSGYSFVHTYDDASSGYIGITNGELQVNATKKTKTNEEDSKPEVNEKPKEKKIELVELKDDTTTKLANMDSEQLKEALVRLALKAQDKTSVAMTDLIAEYSMLTAAATEEKPKEKEKDNPLAQSLSSIGNRRWNTEFIALKKKLMDIQAVQNNPDPMAPNQEFKQILEDIDKLKGDFYYAAKTYARIVISELSLPTCQKTIPPVNVGGIAGGEKYIVKGIMFKFALDQLITEKPRQIWMYGGEKRNDRLAIKAAGKEFTAMQMFVALADEKISFALSAVIDYKGYRMIATMLLPIDKTTIVYGSNDSGRTVHTSNNEVNDMMVDLAFHLNLKGHYVGISKDNARLIHGPGDIEVHVGKDDNIYALDFGRLIPPEAPLTDPELIQYEKRSVFYKFLRPEFVLSVKTPLSSDSFSAWSMCDDQKLENEANLRAETERLYTEVIPDFAHYFESNVPIDFTVSNEDILDYLSSKVRLIGRAKYFGINVRHLGRIRKCTSSEPHRKFILSNCVARVIKRIIRDEMRSVMCNMLGTPTDRPFRIVIEKIFNMILGNLKEQSSAFWKMEVKEYLQSMYYYILADEEKNIEYDLRQAVDLRVVVVEVINQLCLVLTTQAHLELMTYLYQVEVEKDSNCINFVMILSDILELAPRIKQIYKGYQSTASLARLTAAETENKDTAMRLLQFANDCCITATLIVPRCPFTNLEMAYVQNCIIHHQLEQFKLAQDPHAKESIARQISYSFDNAFSRCEESIGTIPVKANVSQWLRLAYTQLEWYKLQNIELPSRFVEKINEVEQINEKFNHVNPTCRLAKMERMHAKASLKELGRQLFDFRQSVGTYDIHGSTSFKLFLGETTKKARKPAAAN